VPPLRALWEDRALYLDRLGEAGPAQAARARTADIPPATARDHYLLAISFARKGRYAAETAFARVLAQQGHQPQALYGKAMVLTERGQEDAALACFDEALLWHPTFADVRRYRAVLLARHGKLAEAQEDINRCLQQEPDAGITLYAAACVLARAAAKNPDAGSRRQLEDQAIDFLDRAFQRAYGLTGAAADADLRSLRPRPEFQALLRSNAAK
jgi:tetratricopeptide (TPR) repeat protein